MAKKPTSKKVVANNARKPNALHEKLVRLMCRPTGASMHDLWNAGFKYPAMAALKIAERRGLKTSVIKKKGELTRYCAKRAGR
jgi:hypothetical protein